MTTRREMLATGSKVAALLAAAGIVPATAHADWNKTAFDAKTMAEAARAFGGATPAESKDVTVNGPDIAENGAVVPIGGATTIPNARRLLLLVEKNPNVLAAAFDITDAVDPSFNTRVKMGQSSDVFAVAITADNKVFFAKKEIKVTLGGCGG
ncbi:MAG: thiosulfate oxidation carrier protein SoxY [Pseudomonadota bacterium]|jgi:sulfur-oxidizing protein SoxY|nr:thiosulfate oxidation carrier protein SoxY [Rubrivivax sp.]MCA3256476.1 thiosulfate oxidation carrier protein SoxY [Rubrivivax sp.]MCE2910995.1 thiosulfate oxidation carrier protein SoxY [Rubrivivax sp.]MCZ8029274.1 thiosulfate oxidation carrier protein SoxY [Rubrivivax sp.]